MEELDDPNVSSHDIRRELPKDEEAGQHEASDEDVADQDVGAALTDDEEFEISKRKRGRPGRKKVKKNNHVYKEEVTMCVVY